MIKAVLFDVGEVLVDETREYGTWADWLGVPRHTFSAMFGATIASGRDYRETFQVFAPGFNLAAARAERAAAGQPETFSNDDLYNDVRPALAELRAAGLWLGIAGNQTTRAGMILRSLDLGVDLIVTSDDLGVEKPNVEFFAALERLTPFTAGEMLYVGDRLDNDIRPAIDHGFLAALLRRGPWATIRQGSPAAAELPTFRIESLRELESLISAFNSKESSGLNS
jgi:HAD superfamily hydrolase (TIGR01549 family)